MVGHTHNVSKYKQVLISLKNQFRSLSNSNLMMLWYFSATIALYIIGFINCYVIDISGGLSRRFDGIGGLSAGVSWDHVTIFMKFWSL